jgi:hypothetical protein
MHKTEHLDLTPGDEKLAFDDFVFKYVYVCMSGTIDKEEQFDEDNREYICRICDKAIEPSHLTEKHKVKPLEKSYWLDDNKFDQESLSASQRNDVWGHWVGSQGPEEFMELSKKG